MKNTCDIIRRLIGSAFLLFCLTGTAACADVIINEVMAQNGTYTDGHAYDWIELYNNGSKAVDLEGWCMSDREGNPDKWTFPAGARIPANSFIIVYCTGDGDHAPGKNKTFYTNFKISAKGETILLTDRDGQQADRMVLPQQYGCVSYGRAQDGRLGYFADETPRKKNAAHPCSAVTGAPVLLTAGGFYSGSVTVNVQAPDDAVVHYTVNGDTPTGKSPVFPSDGLKLSRTTPLRVRAFRNGEVPSATVSATYLINDEQLTPIICLTTDDKYLFNSKTGALVKGTGSVPNYEKEWEYPVNIEYYDETGRSCLNQMGTFAAAGHSARQNTQKSIALYARSAYGGSRFEFNPFPHRNYDSYKSLLLRSTNSDAFFCRLRDVVYSSIAEGDCLLYQDALCIQVYINGTYWGHYNLREKINKYMVAQYEGITDEEDIDAIDLISRTGTPRFTASGSGEDWVTIADFCKKNDLNDPEKLQYVLDRLDVESLFTHAAYEIILGNTDFTNVRLYRVPGGKWKYLLFDVEASFKSLEKTPLEYYIKPVKRKIQGFRHEPLNALLNVPEMKARFLTRVADLLKTRFIWSNVRTKFEYWEDALRPILPRHIARWKNLTMDKWTANVKAARYYARIRPVKIPGLLKQAMKLTQNEVDQYFGEALVVLEKDNQHP